MTSPVVVGAESIALLHFLHPVPAQKTKTSTDRLPNYRNGYAIPFEVERSLTSTLAFLSSIDDDPNRIPAICVEEGAQNGSLNVLLAVNKAGPGGGINLLQRIKTGFDKIFALTRAPDEESCGKIFHAIITMCRDRILCRLRLRPNSRHSPKPALAAVLQDAISSVKHLSQVKQSSWHLYSSAKMFLERGRAILSLLNIWNRHQTPIELAKLVTGVYHLLEVENLGLLLDAVPVHLMNPQSRKSLLNIIRKVARYREAARFLHRVSKKHPALRHMTTVIIDPPQASFGNTPANTVISNLQVTLSQIGGTSYNLEYFCKLLSIDPEKASSQFIEQTQKTLQRAKIHAEIQLIFHIEQSSAKYPPRVISSSKDACFLCNTFIAMHGKLHIPRCHGKLYPGWRLPSTPLFTVLQRHFNVQLQAHVRNSLATLLSRRQRTSYPDPNESTLLTLPSLVSTLHTVEPQLASCGSPVANSSSPLPKAYEGQLPIDKQSSVSSCPGPYASKRTDWTKKLNSTTSSIFHLEQTEEVTDVEQMALQVYNNHAKPSHSNHPITAGTDNLSDPVTWSPIRITVQDLPFCQRVTGHTSTVELDLDTIVFFFEFVDVRDGRLSIFPADIVVENCSANMMNVTDIPTLSELKVKCSQGSTQLFLFTSPSLTLRLEFVWASDCSCPKTTAGCIYQHVKDEGTVFGLDASSLTG